ncbi:MAG TPA: hypothetical protein VG347_07085 [Verrucomicrobiae bacterium]|nr:hypothetical protein [Verrucomicrobiae bacterium]
MKKKPALAIASVILNLALFAALAYFNQINSRIEGSPAPLFRVQHLPDIGYFQSDSHGIALASTAK